MGVGRGGVVTVVVAMERDVGGGGSDGDGDNIRYLAVPIPYGTKRRSPKYLSAVELIGCGFFNRPAR